MEAADFVSVVAPILLSGLVTWLPALTGEFIETQAKDLTEELRKSGIPAARALAAERAAISLARGATLASGAVAMVVTYVYSAWTVISKLHHPLQWTIIATAWGLLAVLYFFQLILTLNLKDWAETYVRKPWPFRREEAFFHITHFGALTAVVTISGGLLIVMACFAFFDGLSSDG